MVLDKSGIFSSKFVCEICNFESNDLEEVINHEIICGIGTLNPLEFIEFKGRVDVPPHWPPNVGSGLPYFTLFNEGGSFEEFYEIEEKLAKYKEFGWIIHRKSDPNLEPWEIMVKETGFYGVQWIPFGPNRVRLFEYLYNGEVWGQEVDVPFEHAIELALDWISELNPKYSDKIKNRNSKLLEKVKNNAKEREDALDFETAIKLWEEAGEVKEAARVRKIVTEQKRIDQTVVHGDYVDDRDTIVKDSVINRSNVGGGEDKFTKLKELKEMLAEGLIDDDEFKQMKKEILGK